MGSATGVRAFARHGRVARESPSRDAPVRQRHRVRQASISRDARPVNVIQIIRVVVDRKSAPRLGVPHRSSPPRERLSGLRGRQATRRGRGVGCADFSTREQQWWPGSAESSYHLRAKVQKLWRQFQPKKEGGSGDSFFSRARRAARRTRIYYATTLTVTCASPRVLSPACTRTSDPAPSPRAPRPPAFVSPRTEAAPP